MTNLLLKLTRRWLLTYEEKEGFGSGAVWFRKTRLFWTRGFAERRAMIMDLSAWFENPEIHDTRKGKTDE